MSQASPSVRVLVVEDDPAIVSALSEYLVAEGFTVRSSATQDGACTLLDDEQFDIALVDIGLAQGTGFRGVRSRQGAPGRRRPRHLPHRGERRVHHRRRARHGGRRLHGEAVPSPRARVAHPQRVARTGRQRSVLELGDVRLDVGRGIATKAGSELYLSALEYRLLLTFMNATGCVLSRARASDAIWDAAGEYVEDNTLSVYVKRLRDKIEDDPSDPKLITTVRGIGYRVGK